MTLNENGSKQTQSPQNRACCCEVLHIISHMSCTAPHCCCRVTMALIRGRRKSCSTTSKGISPWWNGSGCARKGSVSHPVLLCRRPCLLRCCSTTGKGMSRLQKRKERQCLAASTAPASVYFIVGALAALVSTCAQQQVRKVQQRDRSSKPNSPLGPQVTRAAPRTCTSRVAVRPVHLCPADDGRDLVHHVSMNKVSPRYHRVSQGGYHRVSVNNRSNSLQLRRRDSRSGSKRATGLESRDSLR